MVVLALTLALCGCSAPSATRPQRPLPKPYTVLGKTYQPLAHAGGFRQRGMASWYGGKFHGRKTANGETYDMHAVSAAHKTLPFGTYVRVRNLENQLSIDVRINDRGPFVRGRIIDLSYGAAKGLGLVGPGTARVELVALGSPTKTGRPGTYTPGNYYRGNFTFQVGAFREQVNAERLRQKLAAIYPHAHITTHLWEGAPLYRVRVGRYNELEQAMAFEKKLIAAGYGDAFIIAE
jgi:rare lipoprotein A